MEKRNEINADFLHYPENKSKPLVELDNGSVERFFNRELSWIAFNDRVLEEASNSDVPLLERVRFLAISAENLDEFYTVRVAGLKEMVRGNILRLSIDGLSPAEQIEKIERLTSALMQRQQAIWKSLALELEKTGIISGSQINIDPKSLGYKTLAFIGVFLDKAIRNNEAVKEIEEEGGSATGFLINAIEENDRATPPRRAYASSIQKMKH